MADTEARTIVEKALALSKSHPNVPVLDVLDLAMQGRHGSSPNFEASAQDAQHGFGDWTDPSSPFGDLLRRAFAPGHIAANAGALWASEAEEDDPALRELIDVWQHKVIDRFAERYRLWEC